MRRNLVSRLHWLSFTSVPDKWTSEQLALYIVRQLSDWFGGFVEAGGSRWYTKSMRCELFGGVRVSWGHRTADTDHVLVEISGDALDVLSLDRVQDLAVGVMGHGTLKATRVDVALDLLKSHRVEYGRLWRYVVSSNYVAKHKRSGNSMNWIKTPHGKEDTIYLGSAQSLRRLRIYNRRGFTRLELQMRGRWADAWFWQFLAVPDEFARLVVGAILDYSPGLYDYRQFRRWRIFRRFVDVAKPERLVKALDATMRAFEKQWTNFIGFVQQAEDSHYRSWFSELLLRSASADLSRTRYAAALRRGTPDAAALGAAPAG